MYPQLFKFGEYFLPTYGVMAALGLILGLIVNVRLAKRDGIDEDKAWNLGVYAILVGVVGAKILYIFSDWKRFSTHPREIFSFEMLQAGGVWYGAFLGGVGMGIAYVLWNRMPLLRTWDAFTPGISLGHGLGRLGCFAAGCCYGRQTDVPWAVVFTNPWSQQTAGTPVGVHLHPTQIYEFLAEMAIFPTLLWLTKRRQFPGQIAGAYAFLYGVVRFIVEFYRGDPERGFVFGGLMSTSQFVSIFLVILGGALWWQRPAQASVPAESH
ncbi:MAG: prolipoprotein diacylglyceryl transferase [Acidobacteriales bacterium]|nr:prolipoprotein diacylglyceryl transferase [Terriglobales bacterium]